MSYAFSGKIIAEDRYYIPAGEDEARAKFAYFRDAEAKINGGPAPLPEPRYGASKCGTNGGYMRHFRLNEERCAPCKAAHTRVELKRQREAKRANHKPEKRSEHDSHTRHAAIKPKITHPGNRIGSARPNKKTALDVLPTRLSRA